LRKQHLEIVLGVILLALIFLLVSPVMAQEPNEDDFVFNFGNYQSARNWACHPDEWGNYVGGIPSTCAQDFHNKCGAPLSAPFSGTLYVYGNSEAVLVGERWLMTLLHGDYTNPGRVLQHSTIGWQNTHGKSTGCHWHMGLFDRVNKVWVNPYTLNSVSGPLVGEVQPVARPPDELLAILQNIDIVVSSSVVEIEVEAPTPTAVTAQPTEAIPQPATQPQTIVVEVANPQDPTVSRFLITWGMIVGLLIASGTIAFGAKTTKPAGFFLIVILVLLGYWLHGQNFRPVLELAAKGVIHQTNIAAPQNSTLVQQPTPTTEIVTYVTNVEIEIHEGWQDQSHISPPPPPADGILGGFPDRTVYANPPPNALRFIIFVSHYVPNWDGEFHQGDGPNCFRYVMGQLPDYAGNYPFAEKGFGWCFSKMASGKMWEEYMGYAVACPAELPFGTKIYAFGREWECLDRGGKIYKEGEVYRIDFLTPLSPAPFASQHEAYMVLP
jgi:hypothetical protein